MKIYRVILLILLFIRAIGIGYAINYDKKIYHLEENEKFYYVNVWGERLTQKVFTIAITVLEAKTGLLSAEMICMVF